MEGCIYLITCLVNGKKYVGQHGKPTPRERWVEHVYDSTRKTTPLHRAIKSYGKENFTIETLCIAPLRSLGNLEAYYAEQYGTYKWDPEPGFNLVWCGEEHNRGVPASEETRKKLSAARLGKKKSPEHIEKIRQSNLGKKVSPETREKIRQAKAGATMSPEHIEKLRQLNLGKKVSPETREKLRQANLRRWEKYRQEKSLRQEEKCQNVSM